MAATATPSDLTNMLAYVQVQLGAHTVAYDLALTKLLVLDPSDPTKVQLAPKVLDILRSEALKHFQYAMQGTTNWTHFETLFAHFGFSAQSPSHPIPLKDRAEDNKRLITEIKRLRTEDKATDLIIDCICLDTIIVPATWDAKNFDYIGTSRHLPVRQPTATSTNPGTPSQQSSASNPNGSQSNPSGSNPGSNSGSSPQPPAGGSNSNAKPSAGHSFFGNSNLNNSGVPAGSSSGSSNIFSLSGANVSNQSTPASGPVLAHLQTMNNLTSTDTFNYKVLPHCSYHQSMSVRDRFLRHTNHQSLTLQVLQQPFFTEVSPGDSSNLITARYYVHTIKPTQSSSGSGTVTVILPDGSRLHADTDVKAFLKSAPVLPITTTTNHAELV